MASAASRATKATTTALIRAGATATQAAAQAASRLARSVARTTKKIIAPVLITSHHAITAAVRGVARQATAVGRALRAGFVLAVGALIAIARGLAHTVKPPLRAAQRAGAAVATAAGVALRRTSAAAGALLRLWATNMGRGGRLLIVRPAKRLWMAARRTVALAVVGPFLAVTRPLGLAIRRAFAGAKRFNRGIARVVRAGVLAGGAALAAALRPITHTVGRLSHAVVAFFRDLSGSLIQSGHVAVGTAQHHVRNVPVVSAHGATWRADAAGPDAASPAQRFPVRSTFTAGACQNEFVAPGESRVGAIVSIASESDRLTDEGPEAVEVILLDCSASMGHPWEKIRSARAATRTAVESLRDGVWFAVVRGAESAAVIYPPRAGLVQASPSTKREAAKAMRLCGPSEGRPSDAGSSSRVTS